MVSEIPVDVVPLLGLEIHPARHIVVAGQQELVKFARPLGALAARVIPAAGGDSQVTQDLERLLRVFGPLGLAARIAPHGRVVVERVIVNFVPRPVHLHNLVRRQAARLPKITRHDPKTPLQSVLLQDREGMSEVAGRTVVELQDHDPRTSRPFFRRLGITRPCSRSCKQYSNVTSQ